MLSGNKTLSRCREFPGGATYGAQPTACNHWGATPGVQPNAWGATHGGDNVGIWWKLVGAIFGVQPMGAATGHFGEFPGGATYGVQPVGESLEDRPHNPWGASYGVQPMGAATWEFGGT